jgi:hypothetical protein
VASWLENSCENLIVYLILPCSVKDIIISLVGCHRAVLNTLLVDPNSYRDRRGNAGGLPAGAGIKCGQIKIENRK